MDEYIKHRLDKLVPGTPIERQIEVLNDVYAELEGRGYPREVVFAMINECICEKLRRLQKRLDTLRGGDA